MTGRTGQPSTEAHNIPRASRNWSFTTGSLMILAVVLVAIFGPFFSPADPMQASYIAEYQDRFIRPPFPPGVEGYPLGSDEIGRDILSRLLWAVRPTMNLVLVVASLRLVIGVLVGIIAGWTNGRLAKIFDALISGSLAVPVLFVALCVIAALGNRYGVWAFILGMAVTGWAESARLVQGQTRIVKGYPFIEASRALGGSSGQTLLSHVIPHIMPLMWIQMAFEVSSALLTTAALGFLGYYINAIWVPTDSDWVALRASGMPELGQMLGISSKSQPWTALFAGSVVFFIVLTFNIFGEGLRNLLDPDRRRHKVGSTLVVDRASGWVSERLYIAVSEWRRTAVTAGVFGMLSVVIIGGGWILWRAQNLEISDSVIVTPGGHPWPDELHDPQGTYWSTSAGPSKPSLLWTYNGPGDIIGGPVVSQDGNLYLNMKGGMLAIVSPDGKGRKLVSLPSELVGWPALSPDGNVIVADVRGHLFALTWDGILLWEYVNDPPGSGSASPIVSRSGVIFYPVDAFLIAVTPDGKRLWQIQLPTFSYTSPLPRLSVDEKYLFFEDVGVDPETGSTIFKESREPADRYLVGADGLIYFRTINSFMEWQPTETGAVMITRAKIDDNVLNANQRFPFDSGVSPSKNPWLLYSSGFEYMRLIWTDPGGSSPQLVNFPYRYGKFIGIDVNGVGYVCGKRDGVGAIECRAVQLNTGMVKWKIDVPSDELPAGGAIVDDMLYVTTTDGKLFAYGQ